jgi:hypothetical protein
MTEKLTEVTAIYHSQQDTGFCSANKEGSDPGHSLFRYAILLVFVEEF